MLFRKIFVFAIIIATFFWFLSAADIRAQSENEDKESASADIATDIEKEQDIENDGQRTRIRTKVATQTAEEQVRSNLKKAEEKFQKAQEKARDELKKAQEQLDKVQIMVKGLDGKTITRTITSASSGASVTLPGLPGVHPLPGVQQHGTGWVGSPYGSIQFNSDGPVVIQNWPDDPETKALREKDQKFEKETQEIVKQYNASKDKEERAKLKKKLEQIAKDQFDVRQKYRETEVKRLEKELDRIQESIEKRSEKRDQIIKRRIAQLIHEDEEDLEF